MSGLFGGASWADFVHASSKSNLGGELVRPASSVHLCWASRGTSKIGEFLKGEDEVCSRSNFSAEICRVDSVLEEGFVHLSQLGHGELWFAETKSHVRVFQQASCHFSCRINNVAVVEL